MKKKGIIISIIGIFLISALTIILISKNNKKYIMYDGIMLAMTLTDTNGNTNDITEFPSGTNYTANISCENARGLWLPKEDGTGYEFILEEITGKVKCNIAFKVAADGDKLISVIQAEKARTDANDGICSKSEYTTKSTCESNSGIWWGVYDENGLRYEGLQPNNHVWFNNEIWRIIGYVPTKDANGNAAQLVKIIRNKSIGGLTINSSGSTYVGSRMYNLLNTYYYGAKDGTKSGYCYGYSLSGTTCNYESIGLNTISQNMIEPVQWAIGIQSSISNVGTHYATEVGTYTNTSGGINIGLMNISDYGYSVIDDDCARSTSLSSYDSTSCAGKAWLYGQGYEWTMSPYSSNDVWYVDINGNAHNYSSDGARGALSARPVLYLDAGVYKISGSGTMADPYIIGM